MADSVEGRRKKEEPRRLGGMKISPKDRPEPDNPLLRAYLAAVRASGGVSNRKLKEALRRMVAKET